MWNYLRYVLILLAAPMLLAGCFSYKDLNFDGVENFKMGKIKDGNIDFGFDVKLENPNNYNIKIKPTDLQVFLGNNELGLARLDKKLVIKKNSKASYPVVINAKLLQAAGAGFSSIMELATKKTADVRIVGFVKGSVYGVTRKMEVDEMRSIDLGKINFSLFN